MCIDEAAFVDLCDPFWVEKRVGGGVTGGGAALATGYRVAFQATNGVGYNRIGP